jgi:dTDP-4-dehydrorhamnose reductase
MKPKAQQKILLIGKNGQLGCELQRKLPEHGEVVAVGRAELDLTIAEHIRRIIRETRPDLIVNAAGYTAVDQAESDGQTARQINALAPGIMAEEARQIDATLIHYSTDYVFDGAKRCPYDESDYTNPLNMYGCTKLAGEAAIEKSGARYFIFRTGWLYAMRARNFLTTVLRLARQREELRIVNDQVGSPTWAREVANGTAKVLARLSNYRASSEPDGLSELSGVYHLSAGAAGSWYDFAAAILEDAHMIPAPRHNIGGTISVEPMSKLIIARRVAPISTAEYPSAAQRPAYSVLSNLRISQVFGVQLPDWRTQLQSALQS